MATKKPTAPAPDPEEHALHRKYRPQTLDRVIGQEAAVTRLRGMVNTGKIPNAIAFFGPFSAGKTTLARCLAAAVNEKPVSEQQDYKELNAGTQRGIDDVRELERLAKFRPMGSNRRFILVDEAHCIESATQILTDHGRVSAEELHRLVQSGKAIKVASFNHSTGVVEWKRVLASKASESTKKSVRVGTAAFTEDHPVYVAEDNAYVDGSDSLGKTGIMLTVPRDPVR